MSNFAFSQPLALLFALSCVGATQVAHAAPARPLRNVQTLYDLGGKGNAYFNSVMRGEVRKAGFRFVRNRKNSDATFSSSGYWTSNRGFTGTVTFRDLRGRVLWTKKVHRLPNSRVMAFESISRELRAAK